jgi:hypothetical protein
VPDLDFNIVGVTVAARGLTPLLHFNLQVKNTPAIETIHSALLQAQIQIQATQRSYDSQEKEKLVDLFGTPDRWGQTLRTRLWTHANTTLRTFTGSTAAILPVPCTFDLNVSATKYFYALEQGEIPLLFLFSGTVFYAGPNRRLQVQQISWNKECAFRLPVQLWREMMDQHYPNTAWLYLARSTFDRLYAFRRQTGASSWEQTIEKLLLAAEQNVTAAPWEKIGTAASTSAEGSP